MKLLNELLNLSEVVAENTLIGLRINGQLITTKTKDEVWPGDFECSRIVELTSLEGAPKKIIGDFSCDHNPNLTSLKDAPKEVTGYFYCTHNPKLTSLEGAPKEVGGDFYCSENPKLESLKGGPVKVSKSFYCNNNHNLVSLEGAPKEVGGNFSCRDAPKLESLEGAPKEIGGNFDCSWNRKITSLKGIHKQITHLGGKFRSANMPIKSHVLGLLLNGCTGVELDNKKVQDILNKYLPNTKGNKGLIECQSELLDAGLEDFAEL